MGLLKHLLGWPVTGPLFLARYSLDTLHDVAVDELTDPSDVKERLMELSLRLEAGEIDEEEFEEAEARLVRRLREIRQWRRRFGMPVRGGPVEAARGEGPTLDVDVDLG